MWLDDACRVTVSRDVVFDEAIFPGIAGMEDGSESPSATSAGSEGATDVVGGATGEALSQATVPTSFGTPESDDATDDENQGEGHGSPGGSDQVSSPRSSGNVSEGSLSKQTVGGGGYESDVCPDTETEPRRSSRQTAAPRGIWGKSWNSTNQSNFTQAMRHDNSVSIPQSYRQAMQSAEAAQWKSAMKDELKSHAEKQSWSLVKLPEGKRAIWNRWVFAVKNSADGKTVRHKARLCAKGFEQRQGVDYESTYAPVATLTTVRLLLSLAAKCKMSVHHLDVKTAC